MYRIRHILTYKMVSLIMADSKRRKDLEAELDSTIRKVENSSVIDPKKKELIQKIRNLYHDGKEDFMTVMGVSQPSPETNKKNVPPSKIPQLLLLLDELSSSNPIPNTTSMLRDEEGIPPSLILDETDNSSSEKTIQSPVPSSQSSRANLSESAKKVIDDLETKIYQLKVIYNHLKREEEQIRNRNGKYAIAVERLKAERILREAPEQIRYLTQKVKLLQEGLL